MIWLVSPSFQQVRIHCLMSSIHFTVKARSISDAREVAFARQSIQRWKSRLIHNRENENMAIIIATRNSLKRTFTLWSRRMAIQKARERAADDMRGFFVGGIVMSKWRMLTRESLLQRYQADKRRRSVKTAFTGEDPDVVIIQLNFDCSFPFSLENRCSSTEGFA